jgi:hypothetical protein
VLFQGLMLERKCEENDDRGAELEVLPTSFVVFNELNHCNCRLGKN